MAYGNYAPFYRGGYFNPMQTPTMPDNSYQPMNQPYQAQMPTQPMPTPTPNNDMIFVLGQNEAESYPVAPNATVTMWDKNQKTFYIKTANAQGIPSMQIYDFTERPQNASQTPSEHTCNCVNKFVKLDDFEAYKANLERLEGIVQDLQEKANAKTTKTTKKTEE